MVPDNGPLAGGNLVTLTGSNLGDGGDITLVSWGGDSNAAIQTQSTSQVVVQAPALSTNGNVTVTVQSTSFGTATATYTVHPSTCPPSPS